MHAVMQVYMQEYMHTHIHIGHAKHTYHAIHAYMKAHIHAYMPYRGTQQTCIHTGRHTYTPTCGIHIHTYSQSGRHAGVHIHTYHTCIHTNIMLHTCQAHNMTGRHKYMHTHIRTSCDT